MADFWNLRLLKAQYDTLRREPGNKLVFIFRFPSLTSGNWFSLAAYPMKRNNIDFGSPQFLSDDSAGITATNFMLGNLFVKVSDLKAFIEQSTPSGKFEYLFFAAKQDADQHIYYEITVVAHDLVQVAPLKLNPSPPHGSA